MKDFAKSIVCNTKVGNSNKTEIIEKKKREGATLKVDNGQKLEFSDGSTYVKTSFSDDYREGHNYVGNSYSWSQRRGHEELYDPTVPFGGHVRGYVEKTKKGYIGAKTNGSIIISQKEFATEEEAKKFVENKKVGNAGLNLDAAAARDIREMAAKYWHSGIHDTRTLATTVAWEWAKKNKVIKGSNQDIVSEVKDIIDRSLNEIKVGDKKTGNAKVGNGISDSYDFLMSAGKNDYNSIKEEVKKAGGWTPEIKAKARKTSDVLKKKAKELVETAHKQSAELEKLAGDIESI